ncbi:hypothetical protein F751_2838 [Auxenochlorella protothecoides]|uniref:Fungal lipase-type domain-containing protein n=2 Tax=Auxenochlorella protothecoides TaxID=3075 RepID=A0A087SCX5_AUXPR|nr:hypothetical protein F751_2838 [Auxenochlorella protothecoides]KFM23579.1 hypothetical protein F751_2838 [Auxenochlorella protothecoides]RMZ52063.1 hypothetical protein APUTEX25_001257 [Auxenochlorella protothecoides]|eukprot:RMZ52063.1 hypothetical protein APUTEX25_001257 [Auxenochlorella protothecoides]
MALSNGVLAPTPPVTVPKANKGDRPGDLPWQEDTDFGGIKKQYDVTQEVVLNLEFVSDGWARLSKALVMIAKCVSVAIFILLLYKKNSQGIGGLVDDNFLAILNVTVGAICLVTLLFALWLLLWRIHRAMLSGRTWTRPRRFLVNLALWELGLQVVNLTFFLAPNAAWLADPCTPFRGVVHGAVFVQFSCWLGLFTIFVISVQGFMPITPGTNSVRGLPLYSWWLRRNGETVPADATSVLDLPTWVHADLLLFVWLPGQLLLLFQLLWATGCLGAAPICGQASATVPCDELRPAPGQSCAAWMQDDLGDRCVSVHVTTVLVLSSIGFAWVLAVMLLGVLAMLVSYRELRRFRYQQYRAANIAVRVLNKKRATMQAIFVACVVAFWFVDLRACTNYLLTFYGLTPLQMLGSIQVFTTTMAIMPMPPRAQQLALHVWLQNFVWNEEEQEAALAERPPIYAKEPLFCFETAVKALYYSMLVYYYKGSDELGPAVPGKGSPHPALTLDLALELYGLDHHEAIVEAQQDLTCMLGWSAARRTVVLAFRGTSSMANVWLDLQVWRRPHPLGMGRWWDSTRPLVHSGFHACWLERGFGQRVLARLRALVAGEGAAEGAAEEGGGVGARGSDGAPWRVLCIGHSLGGALACMAACDVVDLSRALERERAEAREGRGEAAAPAASGSLPAAGPILVASSYTYGCPRIGNHAFAKHYADVVPDSWDVVHTNDAVARNGKFIRLYKRAGKRVIVSPAGDLIVRPSLAEATVLRGHSSIQAHLLRTYARSMAAVVRTQAGIVGGEGARTSLAALAAKPYVGRLLHLRKGRGGEPSFLGLITQAQDEHVATGAALDGEGREEKTDEEGVEEEDSCPDPDAELERARPGLFAGAYHMIQDTARDMLS